MRSIAGVLILGLGAACHGAELHVVRVEELGPMEQPHSIVGRDGGTSGLFQGRSVWVYGDTVAASAGTYPSTWRNNTMSWTNDLDSRDGITGFTQPLDALGSPREFFPRTEDEQAFNAAHFDNGDGACTDPCGARYAIWGSGPLEIPALGGAVLSYGKIYGEPGPWNFHVVGSSLAWWPDVHAEPIRAITDAGLDDPTLLFDSDEGEFGIPALVDEHLYLFSCSGAGEEGHGCRLARAPEDQLWQRGAWRFRGADGWTQQAEGAAVLFEGSPNMTVHENRHLDRFVAFYISWGRIVVRTAPRIEGPWSDETTVFETEDDDAIHALAHLELQERDGEVEVISYLTEDGFRLLRVHLAPR